MKIFFLFNYNYLALGIFLIAVVPKKNFYDILT